MPAGGQNAPISGAGESLLWKNAQKKDTKKSTSEVMKRIIPHRSPYVTGEVWWPCMVPSRAMSRHH